LNNLQIDARRSGGDAVLDAANSAG